jgi:hypothetical protein
MKRKKAEYDIEKFVFEDEIEPDDSVKAMIDKMEEVRASTLKIKWYKCKNKTYDNIYLTIKLIKRFRNGGKKKIDTKSS